MQSLVYTTSGSKYGLEIAVHKLIASNDSKNPISNLSSMLIVAESAGSSCYFEESNEIAIRDPAGAKHEVASKVPVEMTA